jgi:hypothetical protein
VRSLAACIVGDTELQSGVIPLFKGQDATCRFDRSTQIKAVVVEAMLGLWHAEKPKKLSVGKITEAVNTILKGRAETLELHAREIGGEVRDLGFHPDKGNQGYVVHMMNEVVEQVHRHARSYAVRSIQDGIHLCRYCENHRSGDGPRSST